MENLYKEIFKRKSFHLFRCETYPLSAEDLNKIYQVYGQLEPLFPDIKTAIRIVEADKTNCKRGQQYCIEIFSEVKDNYLMNIGYLGEQLDLYLTSQNIGTLWFGIGKEEQTYDGLQFVITIAIAKVDESSFRKDMFKSKRKPLEEIWQGEQYPFSDIVRFAPSACNTQPWFVKSKDNKLIIYRYKKSGKRGIMPVDKVMYYNKIDIGIFLLFIELCLKESNSQYRKELFIDNSSSEQEYTKVACIEIRK